MAEENQQQVQQEPQQVTTKEPQQVTTKNPKKVEVGKRLAAHNCRKREELKVTREEQMQKTAERGELNQYYSIGVVLAVGVIGGLGYYIYRTKRGEVPPQTQPNGPPKQPSPRPQNNKFEMD